MNFFTRTILASALAVCASQAALGASVIPHASIPGLVDFGVPFTQNGTVVMSENLTSSRPTARSPTASSCVLTAMPTLSSITSST